jgi:hypothetical protein
VQGKNMHLVTCGYLILAFFGSSIFPSSLRRNFAAPRARLEVKQKPVFIGAYSILKTFSGHGCFCLKQSTCVFLPQSTWSQTLLLSWFGCAIHLATPRPKHMIFACQQCIHRKNIRANINVPPCICGGFLLAFLEANPSWADKAIP